MAPGGAACPRRIRVPGRGRYKVELKDDPLRWVYGYLRVPYGYYEDFPSAADEAMKPDGWGMRTPFEIRYGKKGEAKARFAALPCYSLPLRVRLSPFRTNELELLDAPPTPAISGRLPSPGALCVFDYVFTHRDGWEPYEHRGGASILLPGTRTDWVTHEEMPPLKEVRNFFRIVPPEGIRYLDSTASVFHFDGPDSRPTIGFCSLVRIEPIYEPPAGKYARLKPVEIEVAMEPGKTAVVAIRPEVSRKRLAVILESDGEWSKISWQHETLVLEGWVPTRVVEPTGRTHIPKPKPVRTRQREVVLGQETLPGIYEVKGMPPLPNDPIRKLRPAPRIPPIKPGKGTATRLLACVAAYPVLESEGNLYGFAVGYQDLGFRLDFEPLGDVERDLLPVAMADPGFPRPASIGVSDTDEMWPPSFATDPRLELDGRFLHFIRKVDLFRCRYYERTSPAMPWAEREALADGTPVGPKAPRPPIGCPGDYQDLKFIDLMENLDYHVQRAPSGKDGGIEAVVSSSRRQMLPSWTSW